MGNKLCKLQSEIQSNCVVPLSLSHEHELIAYPNSETQVFLAKMQHTDKSETRHMQSEYG